MAGFCAHYVGPTAAAGRDGFVVNVSAVTYKVRLTCESKYQYN